MLARVYIDMSMKSEQKKKVRPCGLLGAPAHHDWEFHHASFDGNGIFIHDLYLCKNCPEKKVDEVKASELK